MLAKNQEGHILYFVGKFGVGEVVLFSYAGPGVDKIVRLKLIMSLYNAIQNTRQPEKKKQGK